MTTFDDACDAVEARINDLEEQGYDIERLVCDCSEAVMCMYKRGWWRAWLRRRWCRYRGVKKDRVELRAYPDGSFSETRGPV